MDYEKLMDSRNHQNDFTNYLGIKTIKMSEGYAEGEVTIKPEHYNSQGILHGGLLFSTADTIGGSAARTYGKQVVTVNANMEYLAAGENVETLYAYAKVLQHGNRISRYHVELYDQTKKLLAIGNFTYYSSGMDINV
jgi:acyl-CoA thioesterase